MRELGLTELNNALSCLRPSLYIPDAVARVTWYIAAIYAVLSLLFSNLVYALVTTRRLIFAVEFTGQVWHHHYTHDIVTTAFVNYISDIVNFYLRLHIKI